jgi:hypothetical protein
VVACVVVEVKVQQRRPDGGSIPPIARIVFLFCPDDRVQMRALKACFCWEKFGWQLQDFLEAGGWVWCVRWLGLAGRAWNDCPL